MFLLVILSRLKTNMMDKDDPFSNGYLLAMILFFICCQRVLFSLIDYWLVNESMSLMAYPRIIYNEMTITRYATMSMELLFVIIPIRHNFLLH